MSFEGSSITLVGLARIELPGRVMRLCDGGFAYFDDEKYTASDSVFGSIAAIEPFDESVGDQAPGGRLSFLPAASATANALLGAARQNVRMRFWLGEIGSDGKTVTHAEPLADTLIDTATLRVARGQRVLDVDFISRAEKLFAIREGNVLSTTFHQRVWPGERGFDNANGLQRNVAWGIEDAPRGASGGFGGGGFGGGGGSFSLESER